MCFAGLGRRGRRPAATDTTALIELLAALDGLKERLMPNRSVDDPDLIGGQAGFCDHINSQLSEWTNYVYRVSLLTNPVC
jgi:hypothetical protein